MDFNIDFDQIVDNFANAVTTTVSGGLLQYDRENGITIGPTGRILKEGLGEVTGANATRKSMMDQNQALTEAKAERAKEIADERKRASLLDLQASLAADTSKKSTSVDTLGSDIFNPLGGVQEQLGLTPQTPSITPPQQTSTPRKTTPIQQAYERNFLGL